MSAATDAFFKATGASPSFLPPNADVGAQLDYAEQLIHQINAAEKHLLDSGLLRSPRPTGPRTPEGKARSSQNARKHGLSIQHHCILAQEDPEEFESLRDEITWAFSPQTRREALALKEIIECKWALRRFDKAETYLLDYFLKPDPGEDFEPEEYPPAERLAYQCIQETGQPPTPELPSIELLLRYRRHWERRHEKALAEYDRATRAYQNEIRLQQATEKHEAQLALTNQRFLNERQKYLEKQEDQECYQDEHEPTEEQQQPEEHQQPQETAAALKYPVGYEGPRLAPSAPGQFVSQNGPQAQAAASSATAAS